MLNIDITSLFIQIGNFLLLIFLLNIIVYRPIRNILGKRKEEMSTTESLTQTLTQKAAQNSNELETNISDTRKRGVKERDVLKSEGNEEEQKMLKETYSLVQDKIDAARRELEEARLIARDSLQAEVKGFSANLVEKLLGRGI
jgi:F-type H+-transporting ATPase subunit b